jgi:hypothetical protein
VPPPLSWWEVVVFTEEDGGLWGILFLFERRRICSDFEINMLSEGVFIYKCNEVLRTWDQIFNDSKNSRLPVKLGWSCLRPEIRSSMTAKTACFQSNWVGPGGGGPSWWLVAMKAEHLSHPY